MKQHGHPFTQQFEPICATPQNLAEGDESVAPTRREGFRRNPKDPPCWPEKDKLSCVDDVLRMYESVLNGVNNRTLLASLPPFYLHKYNAGDTPPECMAITSRYGAAVATRRTISE